MFNVALIFWMRNNRILRITLVSSAGPWAALSQTLGTLVLACMALEPQESPVPAPIFSTGLIIIERFIPQLSGNSLQDSKVHAPWHIMSHSAYVHTPFLFVPLSSIHIEPPIFGFLTPEHQFEYTHQDR